jgi:hypothetical protein
VRSLRKPADADTGGGDRPAIIGHIDGVGPEGLEPSTYGLKVRSSAY